MDLVTALRLDSGAGDPAVVSFTGGGGKTSTMRRLSDELVRRELRVVSTSTTRLAAYEVSSAAGVVLVRDGKLPYGAIEEALDKHSQCLLVTPEIIDSGTQKYPGVAPELVDELAAKAGRYDIAAIVVEADGAKMLPFKAPDEHEPPLPTSTTLLAPLAGMDALGRRIQAPFVHRPERIRALLGLHATGEERVTPARIATILLDDRGGRKGLPAGARFLPIANKAESLASRSGARIVAHRAAERRTPCLVTATGVRPNDPVLERWGPIALVILAAGESVRFGQPKQLAEIDGQAMLVRAINVALQADVHDIVVVTGAYREQVTSLVKQEFGTAAPTVRLAHNSEWRSGQAGSMQTGLRALASEVQAALFMPVDQPQLPASLLRNLTRRWREGFGLAAPRANGTVRGAPALFDRVFWPELLSVRGDTGGRTLLHLNLHRVGTVDTGSHMLRDVDTPAQMDIYDSWGKLDG